MSEVCEKSPRKLTDNLREIYTIIRDKDIERYIIVARSFNPALGEPIAIREAGESGDGECVI